MPVQLYFDTVFGVDGDLTVVPDALQGDGTVSFDQGYPIGYEITPGDPGSLPIERGKMNYLFNQVTGALQYLQQHSTNFFITTTMNGGTPFSYSKYDRVIQGGIVYQSLVNSNTDTPPTANWAIPNILSSSGASILKGDGSGGIANASAGTDYLAPNGNGSALTGLTASQVSGLVISKSFTSSQQTITSGGALTLSHGLGAVPTIVQMILVCQTNEGGYTSGQQVFTPVGHGNGANANSASIIIDSSNLTIRFANSTSVFEIVNASNGAALVATNSNWKVIFKAFA